MAQRSYITLGRFHLDAWLKVLFLCILVPILFSNCSRDTSTEPPPEDKMSRKLVFSAKDEQGLCKLYTINDDGSGLKEIFSPNASLIGDLWVSPRGTCIVCCVNTVALPDANMQLFLVNIDGSSFTQITHYQNGNWRNLNVFLMIRKFYLAASSLMALNFIVSVPTVQI